MALYDDILERWLASVAPRVPREVALRFIAEESPDLGPNVEAAAQKIRERKSASKFQRWLDQQALAGRDFDDPQLGWLDTMRRQITASGALSLGQLDGGEFAARGGAERAARVFGRHQLGEVLASLNATFTSAKACGGTSCGVKAGCGCTKTSAKDPADPADPATVLKAAGLETAGAVYRLGELTVYRPPTADARARAIAALEKAGLFPQVLNDQVVTRPPLAWSSP